MSTTNRKVVEAALQGAIDAVECMFEVRPTHSGALHLPLDGVHESEIARALLPKLSGTRFGHLIRTYGRELISVYRG